MEKINRERIELSFKEKVCDRVQMKIVTNYNHGLTPSFVYFLLDSLNGSF